MKEKIIAGISGMIGGMVKYTSMNIFLDMEFWEKLLESGITAAVCGFLGVLGKHLFDMIKQVFTKRKNVK